jgi:hypothetical protein
VGAEKRIDRREPPAVADEAVLVRHAPRNRGTARSKLRRDGRHCPICIAAFAKNARRTRLQRCCDACGAHPQPEKTCVKCGAEAIWQARGLAACRRCGLHGEAAAVISMRNITTRSIAMLDDAGC